MRLACYLIVCGVLLLARATWCQENREQNKTEKAKQQLLELENHWLQSESDINALESILAPDFLHVLSSGIVTKQEQISFMRSHPSPAQNAKKHFEDMHVRIYGEIGIVNGMVVAIGASATRRTFFTDVFAYRNGKWQAISAQELPAAKSR